MVWYVLSKVVGENGKSFHSTHATSHALQPMQVVVSTSLQTSRSRCMPWPAEDPEWPEIISACSALRSAISDPHSLVERRASHPAFQFSAGRARAPVAPLARLFRSLLKSL